MSRFSTPKEKEAILIIEKGWSKTSHDFILPSDEIHLFRIFPKKFLSVIKSLYASLGDSEKIHAAKIKNESSRNMYVIRHGLLREILKKYLIKKEIDIQVDPNGKPYLKPESKAVPLYFNITHSRSMALFAFSSCEKIGIDLEFCCEIPEARLMAGYFMTSRECAELELYYGSDLLALFYKIWTLKEARVKAVGLGFHKPLNSFEVPIFLPLPKDTPGKSFGFAYDAGWNYYSFSPLNKYQASLVYQGDPSPVRLWDFGTSFLN